MPTGRARKHECLLRVGAHWVAQHVIVGCGTYCSRNLSNPGKRFRTVTRSMRAGAALVELVAS
eukprot:2679864-Prymnesium_polylepis.1